MADNKTFTLTAEELQNIIKSSIEATVGAAVPKQSNIVEEIATANKMDQIRAQAALNFNRNLLNSKLVEINLPVSLSDYFGNSVTVSVNGNTIKVPVDGTTHKISKAHYQQLQKKINHNNIQLSRIKNIANRNIFGINRGDVGVVNL